MNFEKWLNKIMEMASDMFKNRCSTCGKFGRSHETLSRAVCEIHYMCSLCKTIFLDYVGTLPKCPICYAALVASAYFKTNKKVTTSPATSACIPSTKSDSDDENAESDEDIEALLSPSSPQKYCRSMKQQKHEDRLQVEYNTQKVDFPYAPTTTCTPFLVYKTDQVTGKKIRFFRYEPAKIVHKKYTISGEFKSIDVENSDLPVFETATNTWENMNEFSKHTSTSEEILHKNSEVPVTSNNFTAFKLGMKLQPLKLKPAKVLNIIESRDPEAEAFEDFVMEASDSTLLANQQNGTFSANLNNILVEEENNESS